MKEMQTRRNVLLWVLYDFANSIVSIVFFLYFAQWIVIDRGLSDFWFNLTFTISTIFLICTAPFIGVLLDKHLRRIVGLRINTVLVFLLYSLCAWFAVSDNNLGGLITFTLGMYIYQLGFTFYTPLINDISPLEKRGRISGYGIAANHGFCTYGLDIHFASNWIYPKFHIICDCNNYHGAMVWFKLGSLSIGYGIPHTSQK